MITEIFCLALFLSSGQAAAAKGPEYGILLMAHGGGPSWNEAVLELRRELDVEVPTEVAFGMADPGELQKAIERLESRRAAKIVAVPLFVNSASEVLHHTRYVLGIEEAPSEVLRDALAAIPVHAHGASAKGSHHNHGFSLQRVRTSLPLVMTRALDDHPLVGGILLERARALSRDPSRETVILVGHGPVDEKANRVWLATMARLARGVRVRGRFKAVRAATIRDDSPEDVKAKAGAALRRMVKEADGGGGRALVIPYLIARGGIEDHITRILEGLPYSWDGRTICPHPNAARWAAEMAAEGSRKGGMRSFE